MAKKNIWDAVPKDSIKKEAEKAMERTTKPVSHIGREEGNTRGPEKREEKLTRLLVKDADRKKLKTLASLMDETMIDAFHTIIQKAYEERMK